MGAFDAMPRLEIVIPTRNHPESVELLLTAYHKLFDCFDFSVSIHDSSDDDLTLKACEKSSFFNRRVRYFKYDVSVSIDEKTLLALKQGCADYLLLCTDGILVKADNLFESGLLEEKFNVCCMYPKDRMVERIYYARTIAKQDVDSSKYLFFYHNFWELILYGASIISKEIAESIDVSEMCRKYSGTGFIYPSTLVELAENGFRTVFLDVFADTPLHKSGWLKSGHAIEQWSKSLHDCVAAIDDCYLDERTKKHILYEHKLGNFLSTGMFLYFKYYRSFDFRIFRKYRSYVLDMMSATRIGLYFALVVPRFLIVIPYSAYDWILKKMREKRFCRYMNSIGCKEAAE